MTSLAWALVLLLPSSALAGWMDLPAQTFHLQAPPTAGSRAYQQDFQILHESETQRTAADCALAEQQKVPSFENFFGPGSQMLSRREFEDARALLTRAFKLGERVSGHYKDRFRRPRPYQVDRSLRPCAYRPEGSRAYPSGHATLAALGSCILAHAYPERAKRIEDWGYYLGNLRTLVGVHHPSDVAAGQDLAEQLCARMFAEPDFLQEYNAVFR